MKRKFFISDHHFFNYNVNTYCDRPYIHIVVDNKIYFNNTLITETEDNKSAIYLARKLTVDLMNKDMIEKWNSVVDKDDDVYYGGDFAFPCDVIKGKAILDQLNGNKYLIVGNHDGNKKKMQEMGFIDAVDSMELELKDGSKVLLSHYPYIDPVFSNLMKILKRSGKPKLTVPQYSKAKGEVPDSLFETMNSIYEKMENPFVDFKKNKGYFESLLKLNLNPNNKNHVNLINRRKQMFSYFIGSKLINNGKVLLHGHTHSKHKRFLNQINICAEAWAFIPVSEDIIINEINEYKKEIEFIQTIETQIDYDKMTKEISYIREIRFIDDWTTVSSYINILDAILQGYGLCSSTVLPKFDPVWYSLAIRHKLLLDKKELEVGSVYEGDCRNASFAYWDGKKFTYLRNKFGNKFLEEINHPVDDDGFDVFIPYKKVLTSNNDVTELLEALGKDK